MGQVRKIKAGLVKIPIEEFVGEDGNIFFDVDEGIMRLSDGITPGGIPLSNGISISEAVSPLNGYTGSQGEVGYTGSQGEVGYTGSQGDIGYTGSQGEVGYTGSQGEVGYTGSQGEVGYTGSQGKLSNWRRITSNILLENGDQIIADTVVESFTVTLPVSPQLGYTVKLADGNDWETNNLIINGNGKSISGIDDNLLLDIKGSIIELIYNGNEWEIYASSGPVGYTGSQGKLSNWRRITSDILLENGDQIIADTVVESFTVTLPVSPQLGYTVKLADGNDWETNNLIINGNGNSISGINDNLLLDIKGSIIELIYNGNEWELYTSSGPVGYTGSKGEVGYTGSKGELGYVGSKGELGYAGSNGEVGYTGSKGDLGYTGSKGELGYTGSKGDIGIKGETGFTGSSGIGQINNTNENDVFYISFLSSSSGTSENIYVSDSKFYLNPYTGILTSIDFNAVSDETLKENIQEISNSLAIINKLKPVKFKWKNLDKKSYGFIAQDVEKILPEIVNTTGVKSLSYIQIISLLVDAIKEISFELDKLKK